MRIAEINTLFAHGCARREASKKASLMVDNTSLDDSREPLRLPAFEKAVMMAVTRALEMWRDEAMDGARARACPQGQDGL